MTLKKRSTFGHVFVLLGSAFGTISDGARGVWQSRTRHRWLVPLLVFLCTLGLFLAVAATVQALAPFLYTIF